MKQFKHIITSGCSFSDIRNNITWPLHLGATFDIEATHTGLASQGNGLIARKAIHAVHQALKKNVAPEDILVGIMWSGPDRHDMYFSWMNSQLDEEVKRIDTMLINPTTFVTNDAGGWLIMNHHWNEKYNKIYYSHFHDSVYQRVLTYEKVLWTQNYLKNLGVNYFMSSITDDVFCLPDDIANNPNLTWLVEQVDQEKFLPVSSIHSWTKKYWTDTDFPAITVELSDGTVVKVPDTHPTRDMHVRFVKEVILPYIKETMPEYNCPEFKEFISEHI